MMNRPFKRFISSFFCFTTVAAIIFGTAAPLFSPPLAVAQTTPQNTDIFTGQFIPAYFGAAYDPSEAFKQMAGLPVYVFSYDTFGKTVNNYAYQTQIKADGSFQAAGLPNASHYGVCLGTSDVGAVAFRAPLSDNKDQISTSFAYSQGVFSGSNPQNQNGATVALSNGFGAGTGCRVFLTSSRTVDIANHINIFPLIPMTALSVIISDQTASLNDPYNRNRPYEVYAQRIVINNNNPDCTTNCSSSNILSNGPIIRGRSIQYVDPSKVAGGSDTLDQHTGTIFQAYAPPGMYAITYWRPNDRDVSSTVTYLNFDGSQPLNSAYNGMAFETVNAFGTPGDDSWAAKSSRNVSDASWKARAGSINIWGLFTAGGSGNATTPIAALPVSISGTDSSGATLSWVDIANRTCKIGSNNGTTNNFGVYYFSSSCNSSFADHTISASISLATNLSKYNPNNDNAVSANTSEGPSRKDISLSTIPTNATSGMLMKSGKPLASVWLNLEVDGHRTNNVAQTQSDGRFYIPGSYFTDNPYSNYKLSLNLPFISSNAASKYNTVFAFDGQSLHNPRLASNDFGTIAVDRQMTSLERTLANATLPNLFDSVHFPVAFAAGLDAGPGGGGINTVNPSYIPFLFNTTQLMQLTGNTFNKSNYKLEQIEMDQPTEDTYIQNNTPMFKRADKNANGQSIDGYVLQDPTNASSSPIIGVAVQEASSDQSWRSEFDKFKDSTNTLTFMLKLHFSYTNQSSTSNGQQNQQTGQPTENPTPQALEAQVPIKITRIDGATPSYTYSYDPIVLTALVPSCSDGFKIDLVHGLDFGAFIAGAGCRIVMGGINAVTGVMNFIADHFFTVDPLSYPIVKDIWNIVRNFVNAMAVFILLIAGVAIMLRYEPKTFSLQSVLTRLIITIVLVNFSILIIQVAIDIANVFAFGGYHFITGALEAMNGTKDTGLGAAGAASGFAALVAFMVASIFASGGTVAVGWVGLLITLIVILGGIFLRIMAEYYIRVATLVLCIVFAPAAFGANLLPGTQSLFKKWQNLLIGTLASQVAFALILGIALGIMRSTVSASGFQASFLFFILSAVLFYFSAKVPAMAAKSFGADISANFMGTAAKGLSTFSKSTRLAFGREERLKRSASLDAENRERERLNVKGVSRLGRVARFSKSTYGIGPASLTELNEIRDKSNKAGVSAGTEALETYGEDEQLVVQSAIRQRLLKNDPTLEYEEAKKQAQDESKKSRIPFRGYVNTSAEAEAKKIRPRLEGAVHRRHESMLDATVEAAAFHQADSNIAGFPTIKPHMEAFAALAKDPNDDDQLFGLSNNEIMSMEYAFNGDRPEQLAMYKKFRELVRTSGTDIRKVKDLKKFISDKSNEFETLYGQFGASQANIERGDVNDSIMAFATNTMAGKISPTYANAHRSMATNIKRGTNATAGIGRAVSTGPTGGPVLPQFAPPTGYPGGGLTLVAGVPPITTAPATLAAAQANSVQGHIDQINTLNSAGPITRGSREEVRYKIAHAALTAMGYA
jgi:hypothetical protein